MPCNENINKVPVRFLSLEGGGFRVTPFIFYFLLDKRDFPRYTIYRENETGKELDMEPVTFIFIAGAVLGFAVGFAIALGTKLIVGEKRELKVKQEVGRS